MTNVFMSCPQQPCSAPQNLSVVFYGLNPSPTWFPIFLLPTVFPSILASSKEPWLLVTCLK